jgi:hypothetical protein
MKLEIAIQRIMAPHVQGVASMAQVAERWLARLCVWKTGTSRLADDGMGRKFWWKRSVCCTSVLLGEVRKGTNTMALRAANAMPQVVESTDLSRLARMPLSPI